MSQSSVSEFRTQVMAIKNPCYVYFFFSSIEIDQTTEAKYLICGKEYSFMLK